MLINFSTRNFKSIKDDMLLNLTATKRFDIKNTISAEKYGMHVLPITGIYGANGSGKSNLVSAIEFMKQKISAGDSLSATPFRFGKDEDTSPSNFSMLFIDENNLMYHYGFSINGNEIEEEWLSCYYTKRETTLFTRIKTDDNSFEYYFGNKFIKQTKEGRKYLDFITLDLASKKLLLTELAVKKANQFCQDVYNWFDKNLIVMRPDYGCPGGRLAIILNEEFRKDVSDILKKIDFDFASLNVISREVDKTYLLNNVYSATDSKEAIENSIDSKTGGIWFSATRNFRIYRQADDGRLWEDELIIKHNRADGQKAILSVAEASSGFRRMLDLVLIVLDINKDRTYVIDEIEQSLHTLISKALISMSIDNSINKKLNSQLVFITHDTNLLDTDILRKDEIQFMEKNRNDSSSYITNYAEFRTSPGQNAEKGYLSGRFGAIPFIQANLEQK